MKLVCELVFGCVARKRATGNVTFRIEVRSRFEVPVLPLWLALPFGLFLSVHDVVHDDVVRWCGSQHASYGQARNREEVENADQERAGMRCHVFDVWRQEVFAKEGVLRAAGEGLDEIFLVDSGIERLRLT